MKFHFLNRGASAPVETKAQGQAMTVDQILKALDGMNVNTLSGYAVNEQNAMMQSTVFSCVRILSESIAMLPVKMMEKKGGNRVEVTQHDALGVLLEPNGWQTPHDFWAFMVANIELQGNGYAYKNKGSKGKVLELLPMETSETTPEQKPDFSLVYKNKGSLKGEYNADQIFHARNLSHTGAGVAGLSTISLHREAIGLAKQTEAHGAALFKNGAQIGRVLEHPQTLSDSAFERLEKSLEEKFTGAENAHKSLILEEGMKINSIAMTSEDAQFLETRRFQKQDIASIFGVPMFLLNDTEKSTTWGSGLEQLSRSFIRFTLAPRVSRLQQTLARELLNRQERKRFEFVFDTDGFAMGDLAARFTAYQTGINAGILNPNEAREREGLNPRKGGDEYVMSVNAVKPETETDDNGTGGADDESEE